MPRLFEKSSGRLIGEIDQTDLDILFIELEEESSIDTDYWIDAATLDLLAANGASASAVALLRGALGDAEGIEIRWEADPE